MKPSILRTVATLIIASGCAVAHAEGTAHSLDQVPSQFESPDARAAWLRDMGGSDSNTGFGTRLPPGFSKAGIVAQLAPGADPATAVLVGVKPWPRRSGAYVAIACLAPDPKLAADALRYRAPDACEGYPLGVDNDTPETQVWLGVFELGTDGAPHLIARTEQPLSDYTDWSASNIEAPGEADANDVSVRPERWLRFDLAAYQLRPDDYAFGVRAGWSIGYSGGGASYEALYLLRIDGHALRVVLAQPMMFYEDIAGDWHKNGTRDHDIRDTSDTLSVLPATTSGFHDFQLRERNGKWRRTFRWSSADGRYVGS